LTQDNPNQQRQFAALESLIQKKISIGNEAINCAAAATPPAHSSSSPQDKESKRWMKSAS